MSRFLDHCDMAMSSTPDMEYYSSIALCAFDAVFSIRADYDKVVKPLVNRLCMMLDIPIRFENPYSIPTLEQQIKISDFKNRLNCNDPIVLAERLNNRQRTSTRNGILKTSAFLQYLETFNELGIETYQNLEDEQVNERLKSMLRNIPGQNVAVDYFFMLAGNTDDVKVDTWIRRFVIDAVGQDLPANAIKQLFTEAVTYYRANGYPDMTVRHLDHIIWTWQKSK